MTSPQPATLIAPNSHLGTTFEGYDSFDFQQHTPAGEVAHLRSGLADKIELANLQTANSDTVQRLLQDVKNDHDPLINATHSGIAFDTVQLPHGSLQDHFILHHL